MTRTKFLHISWKKRAKSIEALHRAIGPDRSLAHPFPDLSTKENHPLSNTITETIRYGQLTIPLSLLSRKP